MLKELAPGQLWTADMRAQKLGFEYGARMTVIRLSAGGLFLHSPVALSTELKEDLDRLGPVRSIVAPSRFHYEHVAEFARAYPAADIYAARAALPKLAGAKGAQALYEVPAPDWAGAIEQAPFCGSSLYDEIDFYHGPTRTLILTDLLFNIPRDRSWSTRLVAKSLGILGKPSPSWSFRMFPRDRDAVRASLERLLSWDFDRVILSHGDPVETGGHAVFREAFARLLARD